MKPPCPPKSDCWCIEHPGHPNCAVAFTVENKAIISLLVILILWVVLRKTSKQQH